jgi:hypothetical protein
MSRVYLYALLSATPRAETGVGICDEPLRTVATDALVALVGDVDAIPAVSAAALRAQDTLVSRLAGALDAVLPARFGTVVADDATLVEMLARRRPELTRALARVAGCEQMTLRVWGQAGAPAPPAPAVGDGPGARYLAARRHAHERARQVPELDGLRPALAPLVRDERIERHDRPPLLATVQHLVGRGASASYRTAVEVGAARLSPWRVSVSGPWLPYAFGEAAA